MTSERAQERDPFTKKPCPITGEHCRALSKLAIHSTGPSKKHETIMQAIDQISVALEDCDTIIDVCGVEHNKVALRKYFYK